MDQRFECSSFIFKIQKPLQFKRFYGIYWATLGFLDTEKVNFINYMYGEEKDVLIKEFRGPCKVCCVLLARVCLLLFI